MIVGGLDRKSEGVRMADLRQEAVEFSNEVLGGRPDSIAAATRRLPLAEYYLTLRQMGCEIVTARAEAKRWWSSGR